MDYVTHTCRNCGCAFIAEDYTNCQDIQPRWRLCEACTEAKGIDYNSQKPWNSYSEEKKKMIQEQIERLKEFQFKSKN